MGGHKSELFKGTLGSGKPKNVFSNSNLPAPAPVALSTGNTIRDNLLEMMQLVPLKRSGYFGERSKRQKSGKVRIVECSNPAKLAYEFQEKATRDFISRRILKGKGFVTGLKDGTTITYRRFSSSDGTPVVELRIRGLNRVKDQKIHFIKKGE